VSSFRIDMTAEGDVLLAKMIDLVFTHNNQTVTSYVIRDNKMIFLWGDYEDIADRVVFPFTISAEFAGHLAVNWLKVADYGVEPDHDGLNHKGWCLFNENWGHVIDIHSAIIAVKPAWITYGK
jgi:hypothetical protein